MEWSTALLNYNNSRGHERPLAGSQLTLRAPAVRGAHYFFFPHEELTNWDEELFKGRTQEEFQTLLGEDRDRLIVIYSDFVTCRRSHNAASFARQLGYTNVKRYPGGRYAWKGSEYPLQASEE